MAVLLPGKLLYLAHHCVASWSTVEALQALGGQYVDIGLDAQMIGLSHHATLDAVKAHCDYQGELVVSTVRHPYDAWVTEWCRQGRRMGSLEGYLEWIHRGGRLPFPRWQRRRGEFFWHLPVSDVVLRYETLARDWKRLLERCDLPFRALPHQNASTNRPGSPHTPASIRFINAVYGNEISKLHYEMRHPDSHTS